ncbi:MAG TPA: hypothetical protein VHF24_08275 [Acidimicrobiales bacterium]|nr:hypothetical protein [Acidimicrobiales bacterium]
MTPAGGARRHLAAALPGWVAARIVVSGALGLAHLVAAKVDDRLPGYGERVARGLLSWDGRWYLDIAERGYPALPDESLRFFPLYPLLGRALSPLTGGRDDLALLLVANLSALALGALLHRLCLLETGDEALARRAAWLVALVPPFFVMVMGYAEPLALTLSVACFLGLRIRSWGWAALAGFLAGLTRPVGVLLAVPAAVEGARGLRAATGRERARRALPVIAPFAGAATFLVWVGVRFDDALLPLDVQNRPHLRGGFADPVTTVLRAAGDLLGGDVGLGTNAVRLPWVVAAAVLVVVACRRWPASYGAYAVVTVVAALAAERLGSFERYAFGAFPLVLGLASLTEAAWAERLTLSVGATLLGGYAVLAFLLYYVP